MTASAQVLAAAGWRVAVVPDAARLAAAWQELYRPGATRRWPARGAGGRRRVRGAERGRGQRLTGEAAHG